MISGPSLKKTVYIFIDASNLWQAQKAKGTLFDYEKLLHHLKSEFSADTIKVFYYSAYPANGTRAYSLDSRHKFFTYLKKGLGFVVRKKELKRIVIHAESGDSYEEKGNMDVELTIDAIHFKHAYQTAVFFTGDSDFLAPVTYLRKSGKKVYVFSSKNHVSRELRTGADGYVDIFDIKRDIWRRDVEYREKSKPKQ